MATTDMKKYQPIFGPLVPALLLGLAVSLIPLTPAYSENTAACVGGGGPASSSLKLSGRTITPTLLLQVGSVGQPCPAGETALSLVSLSRTIIVSPVPSPTLNGTALLSAMTLISNSNPSAANPWLLKLEPGQYDLGSAALSLMSYVDLEGSGEGTTLISSAIGSSGTPTTGALVAASYSEVRFVAVAGIGSNSRQVAVYLPAGAVGSRFLHITATAAGGSGNYAFYNTSSGDSVTVEAGTLTGSGGISAGLYNFGGTMRVTSSTVTGGLYNSSGGTATVTNSTVTGGLNNSSPLTVTNSTVTGGLGNSSPLTVTNSAITGGFSNSGTMTATSLTVAGNVSISGGTATVMNSTLAGGLSISGGTATVMNSTLTGSNYGLYNSGGTVTVANSSLTGSQYGLYNTAGGTSKVGASQLRGGTGASLGLSLCPASYNGNTFQLLNASCQ